MQVSIDGAAYNPLRCKIRLDYRGEARGRFLFRSKNTERVADEIREQKVALLRNVPVQGVVIEDIDAGMEIYTVYDEVFGGEVAYAPVVITLQADSLQDVLRYIIQEEFRKVEVLSPGEIMLDRQAVERFLFTANKEMQTFRGFLERKLNAR